MKPAELLRTKDKISERKINDLETKHKNKNIRDLYFQLSKFMKVLVLSQRVNLIKSSRAISRIRCT